MIKILVDLSSADIEFSSSSLSAPQSGSDVFLLGPSCSYWPAPCPGSSKINCDGAVSDKFNVGSAAFIVRDITMECSSMVLLHLCPGQIHV